MKNELIKLECDYKINYSVKVNSRNRRLDLYFIDPRGIPHFDGYFRKSDVLNLNKLVSLQQYNNGLYDKYNVTYDEAYSRIGCCTIDNKVLKSIQSKFKKMK